MTATEHNTVLIGGKYYLKDSYFSPSSPDRCENCGHHKQDHYTGVVGFGRCPAGRKWPVGVCGKRLLTLSSCAW